jgi:hypothetical protein
MTGRGIVISIHALGATVRLNGGELASVPAPEVAKHRQALLRSLQRREPMNFEFERQGKHLIARIESPALVAAAPAPPPELNDPGFEAMINTYLRSLGEHEPANRATPGERHFIRKKRRATFFEGRDKEV